MSTARKEPDLYPSRVKDKPEVIERKEPVLYGKADAAGPLSREQLSSYERDGFLFLESFFSADEVAASLEELDRLGRNRDVKTCREAVLEPEGDELRSLFYVHEISPFFHRLARHEKLVGAVKQILGSDLYIHQSRINFKPGLHGKEFYWHSDFETWHVEDGMPRMRASSCSISLTHNYSYNGPLMVIPGSHRKFLACVGETPQDHYKDSLRRQEYGVPDDRLLEELVKEGGIATSTEPAGSVVVFECNTMHGSNSNITPYPRTNLFLVYNSIHNRLAEPFGAPTPRPEFVASRLEPPKII